MKHVGTGGKIIKKVRSSFEFLKCSLRGFLSFMFIFGAKAREAGASPTNDKSSSFLIRV